MNARGSFSSSTSVRIGRAAKAVILAVAACALCFTCMSIAPDTAQATPWGYADGAKFHQRQNGGKCVAFSFAVSVNTALGSSKYSGNTVWNQTGGLDVGEDLVISREKSWLKSRESSLEFVSIKRPNIDQMINLLKDGYAVQFWNGVGGDALFQRTGMGPYKAGNGHAIMAYMYDDVSKTFYINDSSTRDGGHKAVPYTYAQMNSWLKAKGLRSCVGVRNKSRAASLLENLYAGAYDHSYYISHSKNADLKKAFGNDRMKAIRHFCEYGAKEGRVASPVFDLAYYKANNVDLRKAFGTSAANNWKYYNHFCEYGMKEGRQGNKTFNVKLYRANYSDLQKAYGSNLKSYYLHYIEYGLKEKRVADRDIKTVNYTVTFKDGVDNKTLKTQTVQKDKAASAPTPPKHAGWTFSKWDKAFSKVTANTTVKAVYTENQYTIAYNANGGTGTTPSTKQKYSASVKLSANKFTRSDYAFSSWNTKKDGSGTKYAAGASVSKLSSAANGTVTLYAQWTKNSTAATPSYNVIFRDGVDGKTLKTQSVQKGKAATAPTAPAHSGYTFTGWDKAFSNVTGDTTVTAKYTKNSVTTTQPETGSGGTSSQPSVAATEYLVKFNANGGSGSMSDQTVKRGTVTALKKSAFNRSGFKFTGWSKTATGAVAYTDGQYVNDAAGGGKTMTLYAVWKSVSTPTSNVTCVVEFDANGGSGHMTQQTVTSGKSVKINSCKFTRKGYKFVQWTLNKDGSGVGYPDGGYVSDAFGGRTNATLYAQWKSVDNTVEKPLGQTATLTLDANGGSGVTRAVSFTTGKQFTLPSNGFTRKDFNFAGWNTRSDGSGKSYTENETVSLTESTKLYAQWRAIGASASTGMKVRVKYYSNDGTQKSVSMSKSGNFLIAPQFWQRSGYRFIGWSTAPNGQFSYSPGQTVSFDTDVELYARWQKL